MGLQIGDRVEFRGARQDSAVLRWATGAGKAAIAACASRERRQPIEALPSFPLWAVAQVRVGFEFAVADALTGQGFFGYAPHKVRVCLHARVGGANAGRRAVERDDPLLRGYVLVGCPAGRYLARGDLILGMRGDAFGRPGLSQKAVDDFNRLLNDIRVGDTVDADVLGARIRGVVRQLRGAGVVVDVEMFGGLASVEVGVDKVSRVAR